MKLIVAVCAFSGFMFAHQGGQSVCSDGVSLIKALSIMGGVIGLGISALGGGIGMGYVAAAAISGSARNPSIASRLQTTMFVAIALIEAQVIYTLVFTIIAFYANPLLP